MMVGCFGRRLRRIAPFAVFVLLLVACGGSTSDLEFEASNGLVYGEANVSTGDVVSEYERVRQTFVDSEHSFAECVIGLGYEYEPRTLDASFPITEQFPTVAELRRTFGYGIVDGEGNTGTVIEISGGSVPAKQQQAFESKVLDENEGGCLAFYFQADIQEILNEFRSVAGQPPDRVLADPLFAEAHEAWRECVLEGGFAFQNRYDPFNHIEDALAQLDPNGDNYLEELEGVREMELRIASTDIDCHLAHVEPVVAHLVQKYDG